MSNSAKARRQFSKAFKSEIVKLVLMVNVRFLRFVSSTTCTNRPCTRGCGRPRSNPERQVPMR